MFAVPTVPAPVVLTAPRQAATRWRCSKSAPGYRRLSSRESSRYPSSCPQPIETAFHAAHRSAQRGGAAGASCCGSERDGAFDDIAAASALGLPEDELGPAERAGIITLEAGRMRFEHPLLRSAAYHASPRDAVGEPDHRF